MNDELEVVDDVDVLGALGLALSTLEAFAGLAVVLRHQVVVELAVALLILLWKVIKIGPRLRAAQEEKAAIEQKYNSLNQEYAALRIEVANLRSHNDNMSTIVTKSDKYPNVSFEILDDSNNPIYGALQLGKHYTVRCLGVEHSGEWKADGLNVKDRKKNPATLEVTNAEKVTLSYYINKDKALSIEYKVTP